MKILSAEQLRKADEATVSEQSITSLQLMERAAGACSKRILEITDAGARVIVICGTGNNGGDGLVIARLLLDAGRNVACWLTEGALSRDTAASRDKLLNAYPSAITLLAKELPGIESDCVVVDALFGYGLNRAPAGQPAELIERMNASGAFIVSIDLPSGLPADRPAEWPVVRSNLVLTFHAPKLSMLLPHEGGAPFEVIDIGLSTGATESTSSHLHYVTAPDAASLLTPRRKFSHKGTYGHALLVAGSSEKRGAAVLSAMGALRSGAGLLSVHSTAPVISALMTHLPEAMASLDENDTHVSELPRLDAYNAVAIGPGLGTHADTGTVVKKLLQYFAGKLVLDADALNILSENKTWLEFLPAGCILTPHVREFERLAGKSADAFERMDRLRNFSLRYRCIVVMKDTHTAVAMPDGNVFFNGTGNAGLAKGGSGDVLTGVLLGLMARGYNAAKSALIGVYIHGLAADLAVSGSSMESLLARDVVAALPAAFARLEAASARRASA